MAFRVQDDDGLTAGANAYAEVTFVRDYWLDRGTDLSTTTDTNLQTAIVRATQYVDARYTYAGCRRNRAQETEFPRTDLEDRDGYLVNGIPPVVKKVVAELAQRALTISLMPDPEVADASGRHIKSKSEGVGPLREGVEYANGGAYSLPEYPMIDRMLVSAGITRSGMTAARA